MKNYFDKRFLRDVFLAAGVCCAVFAIVLSVAVLDAYIYINNFDLNKRDTINWIFKELGDEGCAKIELFNTVFLKKQKQLEEMYIMASWFPRKAKEELLELEKHGRKLKAFYWVPKKTIYLCLENLNKEFYVHEIVHHVFYSAWRIAECKNIKDRFLSHEGVAVWLANRYVKKHRWSVRLLYHLGFEKVMRQETWKKAPNRAWLGGAFYFL